MLKSSPAMTPEMQGAVAQEVNNRMGKAVDDLKAKYAQGQGGNDTSVDGPTGEAYKKEQARIAQEKRRRAQAAAAASEQNEEAPMNEDDDDDNHGDEDAELRMLREKRLREIKNSELQKLENIGKGHGQYREITQDEFLTEVTGSVHVICHFYHREFPRCKIMDMHLQKLAARHIESKFIYINAEKAPFFVDKLRIRTMPTLVFFEDGVATGKLIGFEELAADMPEGKEDEWPTIKLARYLAANGAIKSSVIVDDDEVEARAKATMEEMRRAAYVGYRDADYDLDMSDDDL